MICLASKLKFGIIISWASDKKTKTNLILVYCANTDFSLFIYQALLFCVIIPVVAF